MLKFKNKSWPLFAISMLALGLIWIWISRTTPENQERLVIQAPHQGFAAPSFELKNSEGKIVTLSSLRGQVVVVNFWASWCPPCRAEMPALESVSEDYVKQGVVILGINATNQDSSQSAQAFMAEMGLNFPILFDTDGAVSKLYQVSALPSTFFIGRDGIIQEVIIGGPISSSHLRISIEQLLGLR